MGCWLRPQHVALHSLSAIHDTDGGRPLQPARATMLSTWAIPRTWWSG